VSAAPLIGIRSSLAASPSTYPDGTAGAGRNPPGEAETAGASPPHPFACGLDLHARSLYVCMLNQDGEIVTQRHMPTNPDALCTGMAPYRADLVIAVASVFTWDLAGRPLHSRGHARRAGTCARHAGQLRGHGPKRPQGRAHDGGAPPGRQAPTDLRQPRRHACHPRPAPPADAADAHARSGVSPRRTYSPPGPPPRGQHNTRRHGPPAGRGRAHCRAGRTAEPRGRPRADRAR
jgi:hypothetical protein